jgi:hypothetical protein
MFTKLADTNKVAIFSVLVLCMAVGAALCPTSRSDDPPLETLILASGAALRGPTNRSMSRCVHIQAILSCD